MSRREWETTDLDLRRALGDMVLAFSSLEESLRDVTWLVVGLDDLTVHILLHRMPFARMVEKFREVFSLRYSRYDPEVLGQFCAALAKASTDRNDLIHSLWEFDVEAGKVILHKVGKDKAKVLKLNTSEVSVTRVEELVARISGLDDKLWELYVDQQPAA